jgi:NADH-quinone oxidoreductase subunit L
MLTIAAQTADSAETASSLVELAKFIPLAPLLGMLVCGVLGIWPNKGVRILAAPVAIAAALTAFVLSVLVAIGFGDPANPGVVVHAFQWIHIGAFASDFAFSIDPLTIVMLLVVTGIGSLIFIYAAGYMHGDPGYYRFFAYFCLFILAMSLLVLADNLVLLYLGWEGVGLASYLLIGYYYRKPSAVAAAKKAFIVNRIGDFGFALGVMGIFLVFGAVQFGPILDQANAAFVAERPGWQQTLVLLIPFLLMLGAFGKSAQLPLHVWLPDAMEGPTPVSALIHAATMVTAGVYMIARLIPIFELSPYALPTVAVIGCITALFAATIALCQYDIKRIWAYSTVSQLGYMFLGVGVLGTFGAVFHLFTHAFFKALLFLTAGSVMHALAGQLDLRKMSGLSKKMPVTCWLMFAGCLALAGFPFTAGFFSKDQVLYNAINSYPLLGILGLITALLTAFYTFRLWFRVFMGPEHYEMGREHHGYEMDHAPDDHHHGPHEMSWLMNGPLVVLAVGAILAGWLCADWMENMVEHSTAAVASAGHGVEGAHGEAAAYDDGHGAEHGGFYVSHAVMGFLSGGGAILMIALAALFHWKRRDLADRAMALGKPLYVLWHRKYYVDELYHLAIVQPLRGLGYICYLVFDRLLLDAVIYDGLFQLAPKLVAAAQAPTQRGKLQGFAVLMGLGLLLVVWIVVYAVIL